MSQVDVSGQNSGEENVAFFSYGWTRLKSESEFAENRLTAQGGGENPSITTLCRFQFFVTDVCAVRSVVDSG